MTEHIKRSNGKKEKGQTGVQQSITAMEQLSRAQIESRFGFQHHSALQLEIPNVEIPELENIRVAVDMPMYADEIEVETQWQRRLSEFNVQNAQRIERKPGEPLKSGDKIYVDIVTYIDGHIAMFGTLENLPLFLEPGTLVPGFTENMIGTTVGSRVILLSTFPDDYPEASVRGKNFSMSVFVRAAEELQFNHAAVPSNSDLMKKTLDEILEEQGLKYCLEALNLALEMLAEKTVPAISQNMVDTVLKGEWVRRQGKFLLTQQVPQEDREDAMQQWIGNPELREKTRKRLAVTLAVRTVAERKGLLNPSEAEFQKYLIGMCEELGFGFEQLNNSLSKDREARNALHEQFVYLRTIDYIAENVQMEFHTS